VSPTLLRVVNFRQVSNSILSTDNSSTDILLYHKALQAPKPYC
jgi:hypothetical protein